MSSWPNAPAMRWCRVLLVVPHDLLRLHLGGEDITGEDVREANRAHHRISHAVAAGEGADAARAMRRHLESFRDRMERLGRLQQPIVPRERWLKDRSLLNEILQGEWWRRSHGPRRPLATTSRFGHRHRVGGMTNNARRSRQWQRIAAARGFCRVAPPLIMDEPTAALDARAEYARGR